MYVIYMAINWWVSIHEGYPSEYPIELIGYSIGYP